MTEHDDTSCAATDGSGAPCDCPANTLVSLGTVDYSLEQLRHQYPTAFSFDEVVRLLKQRHGIDAHVDMTGGGVATIYAGHKRPSVDYPEDYPEAGAYEAIAGPGAYSWDKTMPHLGYADEFSCGYDDEGRDNGHVTMPEGIDLEKAAEVAAQMIAGVVARFRAQQAYAQLVRAVGHYFHPDTRGEEYAHLPHGYSAALIDGIVREAVELFPEGFDDGEGTGGLDVYAYALHLLTPREELRILRADCECGYFTCDETTLDLWNGYGDHGHGAADVAWLLSDGTIARSYAEEGGERAAQLIPTDGQLPEVPLVDSQLRDEVHHPECSFAEGISAICDCPPDWEGAPADLEVFIGVEDVTLGTAHGKPAYVYVLTEDQANALGLDLTFRNVL